jgi:hypothetical protein
MGADCQARLDDHACQTYNWEAMGAGTITKMALRVLRRSVDEFLPIVVEFARVPSLAGNDSESHYGMFMSAARLYTAVPKKIEFSR